MPDPVRDRKPRPVVPPGVQTRLVAWPWWLAAVGSVALVAFSAGVWNDARRTQDEIPGLQQGLSLLRLERDAGVAVGRLGLEAIRRGFDDPDLTDLPEARAATAAELRGVRDRLDALEDMPAWASVVDRLLETVDGGIARMEEDQPPPEGLWTWQWAFTTSFSGIFPSDLSGEWSDLLGFTLDTQYGVYVPVSFAELTLARWGRDGGPQAAHEGLRAYLQGEAARLDRIVADYDSTSPFDPAYDVERAQALGPEIAIEVARVRSDRSIRDLEEGFAWVAQTDGPADPYGASSEALFAQTAASIDVLQAAGEELLLLAESRLQRALVNARIRGRLAIVIGIAVAFVGLGVLGWYMMARNRLEGSLRAAAERDALTGVESRYSLFFHEEQRLLQPSTHGVALLLTDMDDFKSINDRFGHTVGDQALMRFAQACSRVVEPGDRVARIGGDEFVLLLRNLTDPPTEAAAVAERLHDALSEPVVCEGVKLHLRATIGIAIAEGPIALEELLLQADTALLDAKKHRRSRHAIYSRNYRRSLIRDIDHALESGAIEPVFQPIVHAGDGSLAGAELLARWTREDGTQVPLDALIEAMLSVGASGLWTHKMLQAAAKALSLLPECKPRFWLNVSASDLVEPGAGALTEALLSGPVRPTRLGLEITERIAPADLPEARATLVTLRASGLEVALDDVGSDVVPLRHMTELPLDRIKLDGSLVRGLDGSLGNQSLVRGLVTGAQELGLGIVAEQVETEGEAQVLRALGVHLLQGWRTGAPVTLETFIRSVRRLPEPVSAK